MVVNICGQDRRQLALTGHGDCEELSLIVVAACTGDYAFTVFPSNRVYAFALAVVHASCAAARRASRHPGNTDGGEWTTDDRFGR